MNKIPKLIVGIDTASNYHEASFITPESEIIHTLQFSNSFHGFKQLIYQLTLLAAFPQNTIIGIEASSNFHINLSSFLQNHRYKVLLINPLMVKQKRNRFTRKTKSDKIDSIVVAMETRDHLHTLHPQKPDPVLKQLTSHRYRLKKDITRITQRADNLLNILFPEIKFIFPHPMRSATCTKLLETYKTPKNVARVEREELVNFLRKTSRGRLKNIEGKAEDILRYARESIAIPELAEKASLEYSHLIEMKRILKNDLKEVEKEILEYRHIDPHIPGIPSLMGIILMARIGEIQRFQKVDQLIAYAGLDNITSQSGSRRHEGSISKRGDAVLRYALWEITIALIRTNEEISCYYQRKIAEGKRFKKAIVATMKKTLRYIYSALKKRELRQKEPTW